MIQSYMEAASSSDPAYIIFNNELNTFPASDSSSDSRLIAIDTSITVAHTESVISNFPDEAEEGGSVICKQEMHYKDF